MAKRKQSTLWWCELCHASGVLRPDRHAGVHEVVYDIERHHDLHDAAVLQGCTFQINSVRVQQVSALSEAAAVVREGQE